MININLKEVYCSKYNVIFVATLICLGGCAILDKMKEPNYNNPKPNRYQREKYILDHPQLDLAIRNLIENGIVGTGMSKEQVTASWGKPDSIEKTSKFGADELWYYWDNWKFHTRIYFSKDIVVKTD